MFDACATSAAPVHIVGRGAITSLGMRSFLLSLNGSSVAGLLAPDLDLDAASQDPDLRGIRVASPEMWRALDVYEQTGGLAYYDHDQRTLLVW